MSNIDFLKNTLVDKGYKLTTQRRIVFEILIKQENSHLCPEEIFELVKNKYPEIGLATIYRTLQLFEEIGIVYKINFNEGCYRYELNIQNKGKKHRHHHLICEKCGKIIEVKEDLLNSLEEVIEKQYDFEIHNHSLKFTGVCSKCKE